MEMFSNMSPQIRRCDQHALVYENLKSFHGIIVVENIRRTVKSVLLVPYFINRCREVDFRHLCIY